jgi:hypothetical protein
VHFALILNKWKDGSADTSDKKRRSHKRNTTDSETELEVIRRAESGESLSSVGLEPVDCLPVVKKRIELNFMYEMVEICSLQLK